MFHQPSWLARMAEYRSPLQLRFCSWKYSPTRLQEAVWWACACFMDQKQLQKSQFHPLAALRWQPAALCPLQELGAQLLWCPVSLSCHIWFPSGACIKYPIHYVQSTPKGDWNKKLFWQKCLGNETRERRGKRGRKIEIKDRKKHSTRWMEWVQNYLQLQSRKKKKMNTWAYCEFKSVFSMCVPKKGKS